MIKRSKSEQFLYNIILWLFLLPIGVLRRLMLTYSTAKKEDLIIRSKISTIDELSDMGFYEYLVTLFRLKGYNVENTTNSQLGVILIVEKNGQKTAVQSKKSSEPVDLKTIKETLNIKEHCNVDELMFVTNNYFTTGAKELSKRSNVTIWDRDILVSEIINSTKEVKSLALSIFFNKVKTDYIIIIGIIAIFLIYIPFINMFVFNSNNPSLSQIHNTGYKTDLNKSTDKSIGESNPSDNSDTSNIDTPNFNNSQENYTSNSNSDKIDEGIIVGFESELSDITNDKDTLFKVVIKYKPKLTSALDNQTTFLKSLNRKLNEFNKLVKSANQNTINDITSLAGEIDFEYSNVAYAQINVNNEINNINGIVKNLKGLLQRIENLKKISRSKKNIGNEYKSILKRCIPLSNEIQIEVNDLNQFIIKNRSESNIITRQAKNSSINANKIASELAAKH